MPRSTRNEIVCAIPSPDSTLTAWHPVSRISVTADSCACCGLRSYDPKGKSTTTSAREEPRMTAFPCITIMSSVTPTVVGRSEEHTSELQSQFHLVCRLLL